MKYIKFQDKKGTFTIQSPENYSGLYFPLAGDGGLKPVSLRTLEETARQIRTIFFWNR